MMSRLFNSVLENSLRILILLDEYDMPKTLDMLYVIDFMALYGKSLGITEQNLNGDNRYKFSVFASHRENVREALKELVLNGTAQVVNYKGCLSFVITPEGEDVSNLLNSEYAVEYRKNVRAVIKTTEGQTERTLISNAYKMSAISFYGEGEQ